MWLPVRSPIRLHKDPNCLACQAAFNDPETILKGISKTLLKISDRPPCMAGMGPGDTRVAGTLPSELGPVARTNKAKQLC